MSSRHNLRVIVITPLDFEKFANNREHHCVRHYSRMGCRVTVLYKVLNRSPKRSHLVRDTCTYRARRWENDDARFVAVDPPFNYYAGLRGNAEAQAAASGRRRSPRLLLIRLLSPLSVLRDVSSVPSLVLAALTGTKDRFDVCVGFGPWGGLAGWLLRKTGKVGTLVYQDRDYEPGLVPDRLRQRYTAAIERFVIKRASVVISIGELLRELRSGYTKKPVHLIPTGVDWLEFARARNAPKTGHTLIYVGNIISWSGLEHAIHAMPKIRRACPEATLQVVGDGQAGYMACLNRLVDRLQLDDCVRFLGHRPPAELPDLLARAEIGLANSEPVAVRKYACPLKVIEYMAAGLPVIATEGTEAARLLAASHSGVAIPYDVDRLAEAAISLLGDRPRYSQLRENGIRHSAELDWERLMTRELELIEEEHRACSGAEDGGTVEVARENSVEARSPSSR